jgi:hypothetical protein
MATTVRDYIDKAKRVQSQIGNEIDDIVRTYEDEILDLNREEQIFKRGLDINGILLGKYKEDYDGNTRGYPKEGGTPFNFFDTGELFSKFTLLSKGNQNKVTIDNTDGKSKLLAEKYGEFVGLTEENKNKLNYEIIYPELMKFIKQFI